MNTQQGRRDREVRVDSEDESSIDEAMDEDLSEDTFESKNAHHQGSPQSDTSPEAFSPGGFSATESLKGVQQASSQGEKPQTRFIPPPISEYEEEIPVSMPIDHPVALSKPTSPSPDQFYSLDLNQLLLDPPTFAAQTSYISLLELDLAQRSSAYPFKSPEETQLSLLPRSPRSTGHCLVRYYLTYHQEAINEYQYYSYYDYGRLFTKGLFAMAEQSNALQFAQAAFAALVFSQKLDTQVKPVSFALYSLALKELQVMLDQPSLSDSEGQIAMASAMQLSTFDVPPLLSSSVPSPTSPLPCNCNIACPC
jgi:hypothetical protein